MRLSIALGKKKRRPPTPDQVAFLRTEPRLDAGTRIIATAYAELSTCRLIRRGPIPWTAMVEWCAYHQLDRDVADHLIRVVKAVDSTIVRRKPETPTPPAPRARAGKGR